MLVVDAGVLFEMVVRSPRAAAIEQDWAGHDLVAPHVVDVEVFGVIRDHNLRGLLDDTAASLAVEHLRTWSGLRLAHDPLLRRAFDLRASVRGWDAMYVALAESLGCAVHTTDARLSRANGPTCAFVVVDS